MCWVRIVPGFGGALTAGAACPRLPGTRIFWPDGAAPLFAPALATGRFGAALTPTGVEFLRRALW